MGQMLDYKYKTLSFLFEYIWEFIYIIITISLLLKKKAFYIYFGIFHMLLAKMKSIYLFISFIASGIATPIMDSNTTETMLVS